MPKPPRILKIEAKERRAPMTKDEYAKMTDEEALKILEKDYPEDRDVWGLSLKEGESPKDVLAIMDMT
jgi:hypothetical protein